MIRYRSFQFRSGDRKAPEFEVFEVFANKRIDGNVNSKLDIVNEFQDMKAMFLERMKYWRFSNDTGPSKLSGCEVEIIGNLNFK